MKIESSKGKITVAGWMMGIVTCLGATMIGDVRAQAAKKKPHAKPAPVAQAKAEPVTIKVEPVGVQIVKRHIGSDYEGLLPFQQQKGTKVALFFSDTKGRIIAFHDRDSSLKSLNDDHGTSLIRTKTRWANGFGSSPKISKDAKTALVQLEVNGTPKPGCKELLAEGIAVFTLATEKSTIKSKPTKLAKNAKLVAGDYMFEIRKISKSFSSRYAVEISIRTKNDPTGIAALRILDAEGKKIESRQMSRFHNGSGRSQSEERVLALKKKPESIILELDVWTDMRKVEVPFNVTTAVGL